MGADAITSNLAAASKRIPVVKKDHSWLDALRVDYLDQSEIAHVIGCSRELIIELTRAGKLPHLLLSERRKLYSPEEVRKALIFHFGVGYDYDDGGMEA